MENRTAFIFAGQGAQHPGMGHALCRESRAAAEVFRRADGVLGWSISKLCFEGTMEDLTSCAACQPAIFVCSLAGYAAFRGQAGGDWKPVAVGGLSLGELSALTAAGAVDFETGLRMVVRRGELMDKCCKRQAGAMGAVVGCPEEELEAACREAGVWVANYNCPGQRIVSGLLENVEKCLALLEGKAMKLQKLAVAGAFHSPLMEDAAKAFREFLDSVDIQTPATPMVHNVTGDWTDAPGSPSLRDLLGRQVCSPVRWEQCAAKLMDCSDAMEETGPGKVLQGLCRRIRRGFPVYSMEL